MDPLPHELRDRDGESARRANETAPAALELDRMREDLAHCRKELDWRRSEMDATQRALRGVLRFLLPRDLRWRMSRWPSTRADGGGETPR